MLSPIYWDIRIYRLTMFLLYGGNYSSRYNLIIDYIKQNNSTSVLELCFGDLLLAEFCKKNTINWTGIDQNSGFTKHATKKGFNVIKSDIKQLQHFPTSAIVVINGALYHFHDSIDELFEKIFNSTEKLLISEPVVNFASKKGVIGWIGGIASNAGNRNEPFRYNHTSLEQVLKEKSLKFNLNCNYIGNFKWDNIYVLSKKT